MQKQLMKIHIQITTIAGLSLIFFASDKESITKARTAVIIKDNVKYVRRKYLEKIDKGILTIDVNTV